MKLYAKIKMDGVWGWFRLRDDESGLKQLAAELCECRVCRPNVVSQEEEECGCSENWSPHKPSDHQPEEEE